MLSTSSLLVGAVVEVWLVAAAQEVFVLAQGYLLPLAQTTRLQSVVVGLEQHLQV